MKLSHNNTISIFGFCGILCLISCAPVVSHTFDASQSLQEVLAQTGLNENFIVVESNFISATDIDIGAHGQRIIYYNRDFMLDINDKTGTEWASVAVIAHAVGSHLHGNHPAEYIPISKVLELDEFTGFILHKMGASLQQAQAVYHTFDEQRSHIPRIERLAAVERGWRRAQSQSLR